MITNNIQDAIAILNAEDVVAIPTETVYGLAGNINSDSAIHKIFELKQRPLFNPLIVHISSMNELEKVVSHVPNVARKLAEKFWPGPLTLILEKKSNISDLVTAGKPTVGVRVPNHAVTLELLSKLDFPIAAPSANPFTRISPTTAQHVDEYFGDELSCVLDGGQCQRGIESTIVGFPDGQPVIYRYGSISVEQIEEVVGNPVEIANKKEKAPDAPGMLSKHYSPRTETILVDDVMSALASHKGKRIGVLSLKDNYLEDDVIVSSVLSASGDLAEATSRLYASLLDLDQHNLDIIIAEKVADIGLGKTINDRLIRASKH